MTLDQALRQLETLDEDAYLCVRKPWGSSAECVVFLPDESLIIPKHVKDAGFVYFLAVHEIRQLLGELGDDPPRTHEEKVNFLIYYAENDAYPDWTER